MFIVDCVPLREFVILPTDNNSPAIGFSKVLPPDIAIDIFDPLTRFDVIGFQVCDIGQIESRPETILHDIHPLVNGWN